LVIERDAVDAGSSDILEVFVDGRLAVKRGRRSVEDVLAGLSEACTRVIPVTLCVTPESQKLLM
jgi:hypothetical protein